MREAREPELWAGTDAGKAAHHCTVIDTDGTKAPSRRVPNNEPELLELIGDALALAEDSPVTWAIDLNAGGALLIARLTSHGQRLLCRPLGSHGSPGGRFTGRRSAGTCRSVLRLFRSCGGLSINGRVRVSAEIRPRRDARAKHPVPVEDRARFREVLAQVPTHGPADALPTRLEISGRRSGECQSRSAAWGRDPGRAVADHAGPHRRKRRR
ncbi:IS110 family transposase [Streptomyces sp. E-08]|uniref:IS110 family transposase n=1 Tax=Streptomyces sp. E-08 TaxID=3404047 RepID=UPI003CEC6230